MINVGMIGTSDGNGHPFSFSAIINGYHAEKIREAGWSVIANYLDEKDSVDIGMPGVVVNSIWTQDLRSSHEIAAACSIQHVCTSPEAMLPLVDAVIIARDDWKSHFPLAMPFLESGISVLIDKPLSLDVKELRSFLPYLESRQLMSTGAMRYAIELDRLRYRCLTEIPKFVCANVCMDWDKYGVHILDALFSAKILPSQSIKMDSTLNAANVLLTTQEGNKLVINCLGTIGKIFTIETFHPNGRARYEFSDNFSAFRRMLRHFIEMITDDVIPIDPAETIGVMKTLIAGNRSSLIGERVRVDEINV